MCGYSFPMSTAVLSEPEIEIAAGGLMTAKQVGEHPLVNLPESTIKELQRRRRVGCVKLGHRTVRFRLRNFLADIAKLEVRAA